jgi:hypothetical protein
MRRSNLAGQSGCSSPILGSDLNRNALGAQYDQVADWIAARVLGSGQSIT